MWKYVLPITLLITAAATSANVDINLASVADLDGIKGIGPAVSSRILDERQKAPFKNWDDFIRRVKGIGAGNAAQFSSGGLVIDGVAYGGATKPAAGKAANASPAAGSAKN